MSHRRGRGLTLFLGTMAVALVAAACSTGSAEGRPSGWLVAEMSATRDLSKYQIEILEDDKVSYAEYERAMIDEIACLEASLNVTVDGPTKTGRLLTYTYWFEGNAASNDAAISAEQECFDEFRSAVEQAYEFLSRPSEEERRDLMVRLVACVREIDPATPSNPEFDYLAGIADRFPDRALDLGACFEEFGDALLPNT